MVKVMAYIKEPNDIPVTAETVMYMKAEIVKLAAEVDRLQAEIDGTALQSAA